MERWKGKLALVTGASSGIGAAISKELVRHGLKVIGVARNAERIQALSKKCPIENGGILHALKCDLTKDEEVYTMFEEIKTKYGCLDICVNNAGMSYCSSLLEGTPDQWRDIMNLNVIALCLCTKLAVSSMLEKKDDFGHIINISSMAGYRLTVSTNNFYAASKHAVRAITQGLRQELRDMNNNFRVTSISPGKVSSEIHTRSLTSDGASKDVVAFEMMEPEDIAEAVVYALSAHPRVDVNDILMRPTEMKI